MTEHTFAHPLDKRVVMRQRRCAGRVLGTRSQRPATTTTPTRMHPQLRSSVSAAPSTAESAEAPPRTRSHSMIAGSASATIRRTNWDSVRSSSTNSSHLLAGQTVAFEPVRRRLRSWRCRMDWKATVLRCMRLLIVPPHDHWAVQIQVGNLKHQLSVLKCAFQPLFPAGPQQHAGRFTPRLPGNADAQMP